MLNLPIKDNGSNILVLGCGGGFDIFLGLPIYFELKKSRVFLGNYNSSTTLPEKFAELKCDTNISLPGMPGMRGFGGEVKSASNDFPEGYLAEWFEKYCKRNQIIWTFFRSGHRLLKKSLESLVKECKIDTIITVDGGVDSLMVGNEEGAGTALEESIVFSAVSEINVPNKYHACIGFGAEMVDGVCHFSVLENISSLISDGGFIGSCSLNRNLSSFRLYESACRYVWDKPNHRKSHISSQVIPAVHGEFGSKDLFTLKDAKLSNPEKLETFVNPLMGIYWFFETDAIIKKNILVEPLKQTSTFADAIIVSRQNFPQILRKKRRLPL